MHIHSTPWAVGGNNTPSKRAYVQRAFSTTRTTGARVPIIVFHQTVVQPTFVCRTRVRPNVTWTPNSSEEGRSSTLQSLYIYPPAPASDMAATQRSNNDERRSVRLGEPEMLLCPRRQRLVTLFDS